MVKKEKTEKEDYEKKKQKGKVIFLMPERYGAREIV